MNTPAHPFVPGTVWAPKKGKGKPRHIIEPPPVCHGITWSKYDIWYQPALADGRLGKARMCWVTTMEDWAGDIIGGCPAGHGDQCCGKPAACLEALRDG